MKNIVGLLLLCLACLGPALAQEARDAYCSRPLRLSLYEYGVLYQEATRDGIDARLADLLAQRSGCTLERVVLPRARQWNEMRAQRLDILTGAAISAERRRLGFMLPYLRSHNLVLLRKGGEMPQSFAEFEAGKLRLGALRSGVSNGPYGEWLQRMRDRQRVVEAADARELMRLLEKGVVDAVFTQTAVYQPYFPPGWLEREVAVMDWGPKDDAIRVMLVLSRSSFSEQQARRWDQLLATITRDGSMLKILREFMSADEARDMLYSGPRELD